MVFISAADHHIPDREQFNCAVFDARSDAESGYLVAFGIEPKFASTEFGYIKSSTQIRPKGSNLIEKFVEKPDLERVERYIQEGYLWNSGSFMFRAKAFIDELLIHKPEVLSAVRDSLLQAERDTDFIRLQEASFARSPQISVDYAVMEKTKLAAVFRVSYEWNDVGSFDALLNILPKDENGNAFVGRGVGLDSHNNLILSQHRLTTVVGLSDIIVITTEDAVLVSSKLQSAKLKTLISLLESNGYAEAN